MRLDPWMLAFPTDDPELGKKTLGCQSEDLRSGLRLSLRAQRQKGSGLSGQSDQGLHGLVSDSFA